MTTPSTGDARAEERVGLPEFEDERVQVVYHALCDTGPAPGDDHWEGWVARHIVADLEAYRKAMREGE